ncbi:efflux RND transporter periplasmic adaptor subunit [Candidatus Dependentiae bacterium]|nr:efflux RND transporter periplasmic adaptor subunit [Candidatus Dependentiae bacterium]
MKTTKLIVIFSILIITSYLSYLIYKKFFTVLPELPYKIEIPQKRDIYQTIHASGILQIKDHIKIGSLVAGTIRKIYVHENSIVKKGELLAEIDDGKEDTDVKKAEGDLENTQAQLKYQKNYYNRQKQLYESKQISKDFYQQVTRDYEQAKAIVKNRKAELEQKQIEFNNKKITSPTNGVIVSIGITEKMKITTDLDATVLFIIARDITKMEAILDIDESDIGQIQKGQIVKFTVATYLDKIFKGKIADVSYSPQLKNNVLSYKALVNVNDINNMLRPGMTINAKINVAKCINCLAISSHAFQINSKILEKIAHNLKFGFVPIDIKRKRSLQKGNIGNYPIKYVWAVENKNFVEKPIKINITDDNYFEIKAGIDQNDKIIVDIDEENEMETLYKKIFKSNL